jgi:hypothetical protein
MAEQNAQGEEITRTEVRPGLVMVKRRVLMPDGRYLLYFDFERGDSETAAGRVSSPASAG